MSIQQSNALHEKRTLDLPACGIRIVITFSRPKSLISEMVVETYRRHSLSLVPIALIFVLPRKKIITER
jgi:hypothetical protein